MRYQLSKLEVLFLGLTFLSGCQIYPPTPTPDYTIRVVPTADGMVAIPPECPSWNTAIPDPYDNQPLPQFGCANARNLALMVDRPSDLVHARDMGPSNGVTTVGAIRRYDNNQTRGLIDTDTAADSAIAVTTATTAASTMTGDAAGGSSSSSAAPAAAAAP